MCFMQQGVGLLRSNIWRGFLLVLWFDTIKTNKDTQHTQGPIEWQTHTNIYWRQLFCAHSSCLFYIQWIIKYLFYRVLHYLGRSKNHWPVEVTYSVFKIQVLSTSAIHKSVFCQRLWFGFLTVDTTYFTNIILMTYNTLKREKQKSIFLSMATLFWFLKYPCYK